MTLREKESYKYEIYKFLRQNLTAEETVELLNPLFSKARCSAYENRLKKEMC